MEMKNNNTRHNNKRNENRNDESAKPEILEQGDIYFFYRPKVRTEEVKSIDDIRRFFIVTAAEEQRIENKTEKRGQLYRLIVVGKKSLPQIRKSEARRSERYWARVGGIFEDSKEMPKELGEAQKELGIEKEASYIITVINPKNAVPQGYPSAEQPPKYPESVLKQFNESENFVSLARNIHYIDYQDAQIILIGAREGRDIIKKEIGIEIEDINEKETQESSTADIFTDLRIRKEQVPIKPLIEGKLE